MEAIETCKLILSGGFVLVLENTFYVPSFSRNLISISISKLVSFGYSFNFSDILLSLFYKSDLVGYSTLSDGLYYLNLQLDTSLNAMHVHVETKRYIVNEDSSMWWHHRLGHISQQSIQRLVNCGVLSTLDFTNYETCIDCIKRKQTNKSKKGAKRSSDVLEIMHMDICYLDLHSQKYFITFIDNYSWCLYLYLLYNKSQAIDAFKIFKAEVEKQCGKQIKIVTSDRSGEYYGRYTESGQAPGLFAKFLQKHEIVAQYTKPSSLDQNGVVETRNWTLLDMVRSMLGSSNFLNLCGLKL